MFSAEIIPSLHKWKIYGEKIFAIESAVFGMDAFTEAALRSDICDRKNILTVLRDDEEVIGFAYVLPENENCCCLVDIAILGEYQNRGLVGVLMTCLEKRLIVNEYKYMTQYAMVENGYADSVEKHYGSRIVEMNDHIGEYGRQKYFKILL